MGREPTDQALVIYLQHPNDTVEFLKFEEKFGKAYVLPPSLFYRRDGFDTGEKIAFRDYSGKEHMIEVGPSPVMETGETSVYLSVDHHQTVFIFRPQTTAGNNGDPQQLTKEEILDLAKAGDRILKVDIDE
ncbi:MAG: hypothetical protein GY799_09255 [Desulfobulbaceae bacterium]|nr:hypothetical protein [Desulfobulbaceae bacterium]